MPAGDTVLVGVVAGHVTAPAGRGDGLLELSDATRPCGHPCQALGGRGCRW